MSNRTSANDATLTAYENGVEAYVSGTPAEVAGVFKTWIDKTLSLLPKGAEVFEVGSAFGRDAKYMESLGFSVQRSDAVQGFVDLLKAEGYPACLFNVLTDPFPAAYDLIFANAVFHHMGRDEMRSILKKVHRSLKDKGILSFSVKFGEGEEWSDEKVGSPRYFCYWSRQELYTLVEEAGFHIVGTSEDAKFLQIISRRF
jgi:SAM-dependent methyltransferase